MIRMRRGRVAAVRRSWPGAVELDVEVDGTVGVALAYPQLVGTPQPGDDVLLNTTAVALGLGTGGYHLVVANLDRLPDDPDGPGHLVKARYTPLQATVLGVEEQSSPWHARMAAADSLDGMPVVIADLHSALAAIVVGVQERRPMARIAYVMSDGGALPMWFSRAVAELRDADRIVGTVTAGQALGGDLEAVTLHSALLACHVVLNADVAVVTQGPGNLGAGTPWGFSGVAAGEHVNGAAALGGRAVASLRISFADARERHHGISHHSRTAYGRVALARADVVVPLLDDDEHMRAVDEDLVESGIAERHDVVRVDPDGLAEAMHDSGLTFRTMGRGLDSDRAYFLAAAAAGRHAASLL